MPAERDTPFDPDLVPRLMTGAVPPQVPFAPARVARDVFEVKDEQTANWVVRKIIEAREYGERVARYAEAELKRARNEERFFIDHYGRQLEAWTRQELEKSGGRRKRVRLPAGAVGFRTVGEKLGIVDQSKLIAWSKLNLPTAVAVVERVMKTTVKDHVQKTGECPDGAEIMPGGESFYIK